jgi:hypothetical protein
VTEPKDSQTGNESDAVERVIAIRADSPLVCGEPARERAPRHIAALDLRLTPVSAGHAGSSASSFANGRKTPTR